MAESFIVQDVKEKKSTKRTKQNKKYQYDNVITADPSDTEGSGQFIDSGPRMVQMEKKALSEGGVKYCEQTSLHGWQYLSSEEWYIKKMYWWIVCLSSIVLSALLLTFNLNQYVNSSTVTSIDSTTAPLNEITFPGLIICNVNQVTASFLWSVDIDEDDSTEKNVIFKEFLTGIKEVKSEEYQKILNETQQKMGEKYGWTKAKPFWEISSQNCSDMVLEATWKNKYVAKFYDAYKSSTDYGACCLITPYLDFENPETKNVHPSNYTGSDFINIPRGATRNGIKNGLKVILDVENYDYAFFERGAKGFRAVVGDARDKAVINQNGFYIAAGTESLSALTPTILNTTESALGMTPKIRNCYKQDEFYFHYMQFEQGFRYSMQNCLYESVLEAIIEIFECKPSFVNFNLGNLTLKTCRNNELFGAREVMDNIGYDNFTYNGKRYDLSLARTNDSNEDPKKCFQRCEMQEQNLMSTSSSYPNKLTFPYRDDFCLILTKVVTKVCAEEYRKKAFLNRYRSQISCEELEQLYNSKICEDGKADPADVKSNEKIFNFVHQYADDNIAVVKLFLRDPYYTNIKRDTEITLISFIGNTGGLLGLCMGLSAISLFELFYHFCIAILRCCTNKIGP